MSFTANIKAELCRVDNRLRCCQRAELAGLVISNGNLLLSGGGKIQLNVVTEHPFIARHLYRLIKQEFGFAPTVMARKKVRLRKNITYLVQVTEPQQVRAIVGQLGIYNGRPNILGAVDNGIVAENCCRRSYLRGCFLGGGSVSNPESHGYHLEIATEYSLHAQFLQQLLSSLGIKSGRVRRKQQYVVYVKDSEQIATFLTTIGTSRGRLDFENARIYKDIRNRVNRMVNCETANVNKTVEAAQRQVAAIRQLEQQVGLDSLSPRLRQIARLRLELPEATLEELGQAAGLSKSAVNHRLRRLVKMAASAGRS